MVWTPARTYDGELHPRLTGVGLFVVDAASVAAGVSGCRVGQVQDRRVLVGEVAGASSEDRLLRPVRRAFYLPLVITVEVGQDELVTGGRG